MIFPANWNLYCLREGNRHEGTMRKIRQTEVSLVGRTVPNPDRAGDVVFVHGLNEDPHATWSNGSQDGFWPAWLAEDCPNLDVWSVGYQAAARGGPGGAMPLVYRADNVLTAMKDKGLGTKPLCFITHSMGGLLVKWMLRRAEYDEEFQNLCAVTRGVVFLSTPHTGSGLANLAEYFHFLGFTPAVQELKENATALVELREWYSWKVKQLHIETKVFYENIPTKVGLFQAIVVDRASADPGILDVRPIAVDADHNEICRFPSRSYFVYRRIKSFALEVLALAHANGIPSVESQSSSRQVRPSITQKNRERMLRKVRSFWIEGVLEHSLHGAALITLGLEEHHEAVTSPWRLVLQPPDTPPETLPTGTRIKEVYDAADEELLILGAPGSGKTTLLLELARELLDRARREEDHPIPVVFNLSSWTRKHHRLTDWLVEELKSKYQVPHKLARAWVDAKQILPLLDGLDEVVPRDQARCIEAINAYRQEHGLLPLVVCSRSADYLTQTARIQLGTAVMVQPLTQPQVDDYLLRGGERLSTLRAALHQDAGLRELTNTPLMLSILTLTYHDLLVEEPLQAGIPPTRQQVFERYVQRMFTRRGIPRHASQEQTLRWLTFLAKRMKQQNQALFHLEHLQPDWLTGRGRRLLYRFSSGLLVGLPVGLVGGLIGVLLFGLLDGVLLGLVGGLLVGLVGGLVLGWGNIHPGEILTWSRREARSKMVVGLLSGLLFGLLVGLPDRLLFGLVLGLLFGLVLGLLGGFSTNQLDERLRLTPNQGIWRSARNGLLSGLLGGLGLGLLASLSASRPLIGLVVGLGGGLLGVLLVGLPLGLRPFLQHFTLRFWLWRTGCLPWNVVAFLNEATERIFLRKVGGGYIFVHRLLLEYFVSLDSAPPGEEAGGQTQQAEPVS
jgi:NACHT domain